MVRWVKLEPLAQLEPEVLKVIQVPLVHKDHRVILGQQEHWEILVPLAQLED